MFSVAGRDGLLPTISAYLHIKRLTPVIPCIVEGLLGKNSFFFFPFSLPMIDSIQSSCSLCARRQC